MLGAPPETLFYAGIGPRETPDDVLGVMTNIAQHLGERGWILSSGYGRGADQAFSRGAPADRQVAWVPYDSIHKGSMFVNGAKPNTSEGRMQQAIAAWNHPYWDRMKDSTRALMMRNVDIILGESSSNKTAVNLVIYWQSAEKQDSFQSGTNHSLRIARNFAIPCFNIRLPREQDTLMAKIEELEKNNAAA